MLSLHIQICHQKQKKSLTWTRTKSTHRLTHTRLFNKVLILRMQVLRWSREPRIAMKSVIYARSLFAPALPSFLRPAPMLVVRCTSSTAPTGLVRSLCLRTIRWCFSTLRGRPRTALPPSAGTYRVRTWTLIR